MHLVKKHVKSRRELWIVFSASVEVEMSAGNKCSLLSLLPSVTCHESAQSGEK